MLKLLYITNGITGSGGLERVLSIKASYFTDKMNYEVHILTLNEHGKVPFYDFSDKIVFHDIFVGGDFLSYFLSYKKGIQDSLKKIGPDIVSICDDGLKGMLYPILFGRVIPAIYERHVSRQVENRDGSSFFRKVATLIKVKLMNFAGSKFDRFVVLTDGNTREWKLNNIEVIPNPMPFEYKGTSALNSKTALAVGKQSYQKGYDRLLDIWSLVIKSCPDWNLKIFGKLDPNLKLEEKILELGISGSVQFFPPTKAIEKEYQRSSIYLMTSRYEGFGMVLIEAMKFGVPCISFDCPYGPGDIINHGENGYLISNGDIDSFAEAVIELIRDQEGRKKLGAKALEGLGKYNIEVISKSWNELFKFILMDK